MDDLARKPAGAIWGIGDTVQKKRGSSWRGKVVGFYSTEHTPIGYCVESLFEPGSVQVWPEAALVSWQMETVMSAREKMLVEALEWIADCPDPGEKKERSATFYRVHIAMLKQGAAKALGRQTVSPEAMEWAEKWANSEEGRQALAGGA